MATEGVDVSILIVSYNTRELTLACLASVYKETCRSSFEVVVVDNNSLDGSADAVARLYPGVRLHALNQNLGFANANNYGATGTRGKWLLLLNPDTVVLNGAIDVLVAFAENHERAGVFGGRTVFGDGRLNPASCWGRPTIWRVACRSLGLTALFPGSRAFDGESLGWWKRDSVRHVDVVSGCFLLIRRDIWQRLGGFDASFFMYGEDVDLCLRAHHLGCKPLITPDATIVHFGSASESVKEDQTVRQFQAKARLFRKHWHPMCAWFGVKMLDLWAFRRRLSACMLSTGSGRRAEILDSARAVWKRRSEWRLTSRVCAPGTRSGHDD